MDEETGITAYLNTQTPRRLGQMPQIVSEAGSVAQKRFLEFFAVTIRNRNTRIAYAQAIAQFFEWCEFKGITALNQIEPIVVAAYIEQHPRSDPTIKQHLAALRMFFDWLVTGQVIPTNPATSVRGPTHIVKRGKTPVLSAEDARWLLDSIDLSNVVGLRDRALIGIMVYSFARVGAVVKMRIRDYYPNGKRWWIRLHEKGGKFHEVPAHHNAEVYLDAYLEVAGIKNDKDGPLFRTSRGKTRKLTESPMHRVDVYRMIKRRTKAAGISESICCHTFRATGITVYMENGGTLENAQTIAAHESPRTTKLYDRSGDQITLDEIERIVI